MDDEETIYSTEIQLEIGELKVVEEEIVYTWGKFGILPEINAPCKRPWCIIQSIYTF